MLEAVGAAFDDIASSVAFPLLGPEVDGPAGFLAAVDDLVVSLGDGRRDLPLSQPGPVGLGRNVG